MYVCIVPDPLYITAGTTSSLCFLVCEVGTKPSCKHPNKIPTTNQTKQAVRRAHAYTPRPRLSTPF